MTDKIKEDIYNIINEYKGHKIKGNLQKELEPKIIAYVKQHLYKNIKSLNEYEIQNIEFDQNGFKVEFTVPADLIESDQK